MTIDEERRRQRTQRETLERLGQELREAAKAINATVETLGRELAPAMLSFSKQWREALGKAVADVARFQAQRRHIEARRRLEAELP